MDTEYISFISVKSKYDIDKDFLIKYHDRVNFIENRMNNNSRFNKDSMKNITTLYDIIDKLMQKLDKNENILEKILTSYNDIMKIIQTKTISKN